MFFLGGLADKRGIRIALLMAFVLLLLGRIVWSSAAAPCFQPAGLWSPLHLMALVGILHRGARLRHVPAGGLRGVRQFTTAKTAGMGYAMLYALMNLGGWLPVVLLRRAQRDRHRRRLLGLRRPHRDRRWSRPG